MTPFRKTTEKKAGRPETDTRKVRSERGYPLISIPKSLLMELGIFFSKELKIFWKTTKVNVMAREFTVKLLSPEEAVESQSQSKSQ